MADVFELTMAVHLLGEISEEEADELRWHLGLGPQPETLGIVTGFPTVAVGDDGWPFLEDRPRPLLGEHGEAAKAGGRLVAGLVRSEDTGNGEEWALLSRQEIHPDDFDATGGLLAWLAARAGPRHRNPDGSVRLGGIRFYASDRFEPVEVRHGEVAWPE